MAKSNAASNAPQNGEVTKSISPIPVRLVFLGIAPGWAGDNRVGVGPDGRYTFEAKADGLMIYAKLQPKAYFVPWSRLDFIEFDVPPADAT